MFISRTVLTYIPEYILSHEMLFYTLVVDSNPKQVVCFNTHLTLLNRFKLLPLFVSTFRNVVTNDICCIINDIHSAHSDNEWLPVL